MTDELYEDRRIKNRDAMRRYRARVRAEVPVLDIGRDLVPEAVKFIQYVREAREEPTTGCWIWPASRRVSGYGQVLFAGTIRSAHRVSAHLFLGFDLNSDLHVLHACDVRPCINPMHLYFGTNADNMADRNAKGRLRQGDENTGAKLTQEQVIRIRELVACGSPNSTVAGLFGISRAQVRNIALRRAWRHVP